MKRQRPKRAKSPKDFAKQTEYWRRYRENHPGYHAEIMRRWRKAHPEVVRTQNRRLRRQMRPYHLLYKRLYHAIERGTKSRMRPTDMNLIAQYPSLKRLVKKCNTLGHLTV